MQRELGHSLSFVQSVLKYLTPLAALDSVSALLFGVSEILPEQPGFPGIAR